MENLPEPTTVDEENWKLLYYFNLYRLAVASAATAIVVSNLKISPFGEVSPHLFSVYSLIYITICLIGLQTILQRKPAFETQVSVFAFADVTLITLLMYASGGLSSGLGLLLVVAIAGSSLMLGKRLTIFFAALATIALGVEQNWGFLTGGPWTVEGYPQAGMLGIGLFVTATLAYTLASRLRSTEALAERQGVDLANLGQVNELIIQHMQSGVLVCDQIGHVRLMNKTAAHFLATKTAFSENTLLTDISPDLATQLFQWMGSPDNRARKLLRTRPGYTLLPRFTRIGEGILIFLEDTAILRQQAQQLKMAALARLTASIAHEIRNPLGAISNAAQLLAESADAQGEEYRLVRIIEDQSRRMNTIVENVMQLSRRDRVNAVRFDLFVWLTDFVTQFCQTINISPAAINIVQGKPLMVCMDPDQLYQVAGNLCQNALRHSPPFSGKVVIELEMGVSEENHPFLDVIDWGTGVAPEVADNIFDPFYTTTPKGTGLGLYIARELCEGNGGRLDYHPGEGVGSRFRVTFSRPEECAEFGL